MRLQLRIDKATQVTNAKEGEVHESSPGVAMFHVEPGSVASA